MPWDGEWILNHNTQRLSCPCQTKIKQIMELNQKCCPVCSHTITPVKKPKGSRWILYPLLLLWIIPGIIYLMVYSGYKWVCPNSGAKIADA